MLQEGGFERKSKASGDIPSSSLADMAFLLLIFFMVSTVFPKDQQRDVTIPQAEATQKLDESRENILHIWVEADGGIFINDQEVQPNQIAGIVAPLYRDSEQQLVVVVRGDGNVPYRIIDAVQTQLQEARAVRVTFYTDLEQRITRRRR